MAMPSRWARPAIVFVPTPPVQQIPPAPPASPSPPPITLRQYFETVYKPCRLVGCSDSTLAAYATSLRMWEAWSGQCTIDAITSRTLAQFADWLLPGRSAATVNTYLRPITAMLHYAADEDDIRKAPKYRRLKELKRVPLAFTLGEFSAILEVAQQAPGMICGIRAKLWWPCVLSIAWETGLRIRALLSISTCDVLFDQNGLYCQAEKQKDKEAAWFPLSESTMALVRKLHDSCRTLLFPADVSVHCLRERFRNIMALAGVYAPNGAGMVFHRIRKSTASHIAAAGGDAQRKLGHSSPQITARYLDPRIMRATKPHELIPAPELGPSEALTPAQHITWNGMASEEVERRLRELIAASKTSKYAMAKLAGVSKRAIYEFANGNRHIAIETARRLCEYFGIDADANGGPLVDRALERLPQPKAFTTEPGDAA